MRLIHHSFDVLVGAVVLASGCALPAPPDGGPRDQEGPKVLKSSVAMGATSVHVQELEWTFDEYVVLNNPAANLRVSPQLPTAPDVRLIGKTLKINWEGGLIPDRTYMIQFGNAVRDLHEGNPMPEPFWVFSTGARIDSGVVAGMLLDPWTGKPQDSKAVVLYSADAADSAMYRDPIYGTRSSKEGRFTLPYLAHGRYRIMAFDDPDGNLKLGTGEKSLIAWRTDPVSPGDTAVTLWLGSAGAEPDSAFAYRELPVDSAGVLKLSVAPAAEGPWVHQLRRDGIVLWQGTGDRTWTLEGLKPGKYSLRSFVDLNNNEQLDAGDWWTRTEAERPLDDPEALEITLGWTVERLWRPGASPSTQTDPGPQGTGSASAPPRGGLGPIRR